jgi:hypothetical protein
MRGMLVDACGVPNPGNCDATTFSGRREIE